MPKGRAMNHQEALAAEFPPRAVVSTGSLQLTSGRQVVHVSFTPSVRMSEATKLADIIARWLEHNRVGVDNG